MLKSKVEQCYSHIINVLLPFIVSVTLLQFPLSSLYHNPHLKKAVGEIFAILWSDQETFSTFTFFIKTFPKQMLAKILHKTAEYYCLTIIDHSCVISFWYSSNIVSP